MGDSKNYDALNGKITNFHYVTIGHVFEIPIIKTIAEINNGIPKYRNSSQAYVIFDRDVNQITQVVFYKENGEFDRRMEWGHTHGKFVKGTPHVQYFWNKETRSPNEYEQKIFDEIKRRNFQP